MNDKGTNEFSDYRAKFINKSVDDIVSMMSFKKSDTLLDVACGSGDLTKRLVQRTGLQSALAFDIMPNMIECAKRKNSAENINYIVGDAGDCNTYITMKNSFDKALAYFALHWIENWRDVLRWIYESLKEGGACFLNIQLDLETDYLYVMNESVSELPQYQQYLQDFKYTVHKFNGNGDDFEKVLRGVGFTDIKWIVDEVPREMIFDDDKGCKDAVKSFLSQMERIPEHLKEDFLEDVYQLFIKKCGKTIDGKPRLPSTIISATAKKPGCKE